MSCVAGGWHRGALTWDTALFAQTSVGLANATVVACVSAASPVLSLNATRNCSTGMRATGTRCRLSYTIAFRPRELLTDPGLRGGGRCPRKADFGTNPPEVFVLARAQGAGVQVSSLALGVSLHQKEGLVTSLVGRRFGDGQGMQRS